MLLFLKLGQFLLKFLLILYVFDVLLPLHVVERHLLLGWLSWHRLLVKDHVHGVVHLAGLGKHGGALPAVSLNAANFNQHTVLAN